MVRRSPNSVQSCQEPHPDHIEIGSRRREYLHTEAVACDTLHQQKGGKLDNG